MKIDFDYKGFHKSWTLQIKMDAYWYAEILTDWLWRVHKSFSSIVNWGYGNNFKPVYLFVFFYEKILSVKKSIKRKTSDFYPLTSLCT